MNNDQKYRNDAGKDALLEIDDDLILIESATGVLHIALGHLEEHEEGKTALAQSLWFTATSVEAVCRRIRARLGHPDADAKEAPRACCEEVLQ